MKISEKQLLHIIRVLQAVLQTTTNSHDEQLINNLLNEIYNQQSEELKEIE